MSRDDHHQHTDQSDDHQSTEEDLPARGARGLSLQGVWDAEETSPEVDESCETGQCRAADQMGFEGLADEDAATTDGNEASTNAQSAWRETLEREGKLDKEATSIRDLVLDDSDSES